MSHDSNYLNHVRVASPCRASWDDMAGGEQVRSCARCQKKVYNLSEMTAADAAALVREAEGKSLCVRFYRRSDGTVMTADCPVGRQAGQKKVARGVAAVAGSVLALAGLQHLRSAATPDQSATITGEATFTRETPEAVAAVSTPSISFSKPPLPEGYCEMGGIGEGTAGPPPVGLQSPLEQKFPHELPIDKSSVMGAGTEPRDTEVFIGAINATDDKAVERFLHAVDNKPFLRDLPVDNNTSSVPKETLP